jgi:hypothetical protein
LGGLDDMALAAALDVLDTEGVAAVDRAVTRHAEKTRTIAERQKLEAQRDEDATKDRPILSPANWIESEYHAGPFVRSVYDVLKDDFCDICDNNIHEILMLGSIGWGKSFFARLLHMRSIYVMSRFANPHRAYRPMIETTPIVYLNLNTTDAKAKRAYYTEFRQTVLATPYFQEEFAPQKGVINELRFPKQLFCSFAGASKTAAESENLIFVVLDEINLYDDVEKSRRSDTGDKYDEAVEVHSAAQSRQRSRFMLRDGTMPEPCYLISLCKETYPDSFMRRRMKKIMDDKSDVDVTMEGGAVRKRSAKILEYPEWGTKPSDFYEKKWFWITTGTAEREPKIFETKQRASEARLEIVEMKEDNVEPEEIPKLIRVPLAGGKYLNDAKDNIDDFIRDTIGMPTDSISQFFKRRRLLVEARRLPGLPMPWLKESKRLRDDERLSQAMCEHPYSDEQTDFRDNVVLIKERLAYPTTVESPGGGEYVRWTPLVAPHAPRFVHVDMGLSNDSAGIAVTCPAGWKVVRKNDKEQGRVVETIEPIVWLDLVLRVNPPIDGQIRFSDIRQIVKDMMRLGFRFVHGSSDGFQADNLLQDFNEMGMDTERLSVDMTPDPYNNLRDLYHRGLFSPYKHEWYEGEMRTLERKVVRIKHKGATRTYEAIDHPPRGHKDLGDAVAGSSWNCWRLAKEHGIAAPAPSPVAKERRDSDREYHEKKLNDRRAVKEGRLEKLFESSGDDY